ncbi:Arc family DNA-binding protein [Yersinia enterocolitica]|nr:Arc family DNA-binding protein [Yersinia enterocolitica]
MGCNSKISVSFCIGVYMKQARQVNAYPLRLEPEVGDWYKEQAKASGRSFNSEVAKILVERRNRIIGRGKNA